MKKFQSLFLILTSSLTLFASEHDALMFDRYFSPKVGSENLLSIYKGLEAIETAYVKEAIDVSWGARLLRFAEMGLIWDPLGQLTAVCQHEIFGHGYRARAMEEGRMKVIKYKIEMPAPYGYGGGMTQCEMTPPRGGGRMAPLTTHEWMAFLTGGVEANAILGHRVKMGWLKKGKMDARQTNLYISSQHDLTNHVLHLSSEQKSWVFVERSDDVSRYLKTLSALYPESHMNEKKLKTGGYLSLIDPFIFYSIYSWWHYVESGLSSFEFPMIPIGNARYLPNIRMGLTPFGPEYFLDNYLLMDKTLVYFYAKEGQLKKRKFLGLGVEVPEFFKWPNHTLGFSLDLWRQPHFLLGDLSLLSMEELMELAKKANSDFDKALGVQLSLIGSHKVRQPALFFEWELGYKTKGFLPGYRLDHQLVARGGLGVSF